MNIFATNYTAVLARGRWNKRKREKCAHCEVGIWPTIRMTGVCPRSRLCVESLAGSIMSSQVCQIKKLRIQEKLVRTI